MLRPGIVSNGVSKAVSSSKGLSASSSSKLLHLPQKKLNSYFEGVSRTRAYVDGGWFKTRNGLTERVVEAATLLAQPLGRRHPQLQIKGLWSCTSSSAHDLQV